MPSRPLLLNIALLTLIVAAPAALFAGDRVQIGRSITVEQGEEIDDGVCIGCSIRLDGTAKGDLVAVGGSLVINGTVKGDAVAVGGSAIMGEDAMVDGDMTVVGGSLARHPGSTVRGSIAMQSAGPVLLILILIPLIPVILVILLIVWLMKRNQRPPAPLRA